MFNLVFDFSYIVERFSMFVCLFDEVVSYLFYRKPSTEVNWWFHLNHISSQVTKRRAGKETPGQVLSCEICRIFKNAFFYEHLRWLLLKMNTTKPNCCTWHPDWTNVIFELFVMNCFGSLSKWTRRYIFQRHAKS